MKGSLGKTKRTSVLEYSGTVERLKIAFIMKLSLFFVLGVFFREGERGGGKGRERES